MIVVTGANGFIGSALVWELNQAGHKNILTVDPITLEQRPGPLAHKNFAEFCDEKEFLIRLAQDDFCKNIEGIFHMGACSSTSEMNREYLKEINTDYTRKVFEACTQFDIPLLYASSGATYGDGQKGFDDRTPPESFTPLNPYGESKLNFDIWALQQEQTPSKWYGLRFFNVYGPNEYHKSEMSSVAYKAFQQITETQKLKLFRSHNPKYADGEQMRDFVYVKDITRWMLEIFNSSKIDCGIYNMGFGVARTWLDLAGNVFASMGKTMNIDWIDTPEHLREQYQYYTEANISKLEQQGISKPRWSLEDGIKDYVTQYLMNENPHL